jgi:hypothetical protein
MMNFTVGRNFRINMFSCAKLCLISRRISPTIFATIAVISKVFRVIYIRSIRVQFEGEKRKRLDSPIK